MQSRRRDHTLWSWLCLSALLLWTKGTRATSGPPLPLLSSSKSRSAAPLSTRLVPDDDGGARRIPIEVLFRPCLRLLQQHAEGPEHLDGLISQLRRRYQSLLSTADDFDSTASLLEHQDYADVSSLSKFFQSSPAEQSNRNRRALMFTECLRSSAFVAMTASAYLPALLTDPLLHYHQYEHPEDREESAAIIDDRWLQWRLRLLRSLSAQIKAPQKDGSRVIINLRGLSSGVQSLKSDACALYQLAGSRHHRQMLWDFVLGLSLGGFPFSLTPSSTHKSSSPLSLMSSFDLSSSFYEQKVALITWGDDVGMESGKLALQAFDGLHGLQMWCARVLQYRLLFAASWHASNPRRPFMDVFLTDEQLHRVAVGFPQKSRIVALLHTHHAPRVHVVGLLNAHYADPMRSLHDQVPLPLDFFFSNFSHPPANHHHHDEHRFLIWVNVAFGCAQALTSVLHSAVSASAVNQGLGKDAQVLAATEVRQFEQRARAMLQSMSMADQLTLDIFTRWLRLAIHAAQCRLPIMNPANPAHHSIISSGIASSDVWRRAQMEAAFYLQLPFSCGSSYRSLYREYLRGILAWLQHACPADLVKLTALQRALSLQTDGIVL